MFTTTVRNCVFNVLVPLIIFLIAAIFHPILAAPPTDYWSDFANDDWFNPADSRYSCSNVGDQDCPYLLKTPADLAGLKDHPTGLEGKYLQLAPDGDTLDLSAHKWVPLNLYGSYDGSAFNESKIVHFDGGNTTITGLYIDTISLTDRTFLTVPKESESPAADLETYPEMQANFNPNESSSQYIKQIPSAGLFSQLYKVHLHRLTITNPQVKIDDNTELKLCQETIEKANKEKQCSQTDYKEKLQDCEDDYGENSGNYDPSQLATCKKIATQNYQECLDDCRKEERKTLENCQAKHGPNGDNDTVAFNNCPTLANEEYASCSDGDPFSGTKHCGRDYKNEVESCENNHGSSGDNDSIALNKCLAKAEQDRDECRNHCLTEKRYALEECQNNPPPLANCSAVADEVYAKCQKIGSCEQLANGLIALNNEGATSLPLSVGVLAGNSRFTRLNDVTVINPDLQINNYYSDAKLVTGGLIGFSSGYTYTINPSVIGGQIITQNENKVKAAVYLGGLIGSNYRSTIINGFASPQITYRNFCNDYYVEADDKYCHDPNEKSYTGSYRIGGLTGESTNNSSINQALCLLNSYSRSNIELNLTDIKTIQELKMPDESGGAIGGISGVLEDAAVNNYYHGNIATNLTFIDNSAQANWETQVKEQGGDGTGALFGFVRGGINPEDYSYPSYLRNYPMRYNHYHVDNSTLPPFGSFSLKESCYQKFQNGDLTENEYQACLTDCNTDYEKDKGDLKENIESKQAECDSLSDPNNLQDCLKELQNLQQQLLRLEDYLLDCRGIIADVFETNNFTPILSPIDLLDQLNAETNSARLTISDHIQKFPQLFNGTSGSQFAAMVKSWKIDPNENNGYPIFGPADYTPAIVPGGLNVFPSNSRLSFRGALTTGNTSNTSLIYLQTLADTVSHVYSTSSAQLNTIDKIHIGQNLYTIGITSSPPYPHDQVALTTPLKNTDYLPNTPVYSPQSGAIKITFNRPLSNVTDGSFTFLIPAATNTNEANDGIPDSGYFDFNKKAMIYCPTINANYQAWDATANASLTSNVVIDGQYYHSFSCSYTGSSTSDPLNFIITGLVNPAPIIFSQSNPLATSRSLGSADTLPILGNQLDLTFNVRKIATSFASFNSGVQLRVRVLPHLDFTIAGVAQGTNTCFDGSNYLQADVPTTGVKVPFNVITSTNFTNTAQKLTMGTNAEYGYVLTAIANDQMGLSGKECLGDGTSDADSCIPNYGETVAAKTWTNTTAPGTPATWVTGTGFGYTTSLKSGDTYLNDNTPNIALAVTLGPHATNNQGWRAFADRQAGDFPVQIANNTRQSSGDVIDVCYRIKADALHRPGRYYTHVTYTLTATF